MKFYVFCQIWGILAIISKDFFGLVLSSPYGTPVTHIIPFDVDPQTYFVKSVFSCLKLDREFPGGPVVRTPCFYCRGLGFDPWSGN